MTSPAADLPVLRAVTDVELPGAVSAGLVLVNFTARWCQPCARAVPEVAGLSVDLRRRRGGARPVVMVADVDTASKAAAAANIEGVPCLVLYRDGAVVAQLTGHWSRARLREWFDDVVKG